MGAGTWATVALEQGLPYFGVALADMHYHEVMDHLKGEAGIVGNKSASSAWASELESVYGASVGFFLQRSGQVLTMLATPTSALYMENFSDAAKGKSKAAEREAEKSKKEKEDKVTKKLKTETKSSSSDSNSESASPAQRCRAPTRLRACSSARARRC